MSASPLEPETTPEEYRQRALLFADLGRYDDAAAEVAAGLAGAPQDAELLATLARVHLVADQPAEALVAAERAVAAGSGTVAALVVRAMALTDNRKFGEAARVANQILARWPGDAYAQRTGAALLSEARNGQDALNAAWNGVRAAPAEAEAHLVLAVVAARLRLFDLAQRAYAEALDLDVAIGDAQRDVGIVRLERRRWALALEGLADDAAIDTTAPPVVEELPRAYPAPDRPEPAPEAYDPTAGLRGEVFQEPPPVSKPRGPVLDPSGDSRAAVRQMILYGSSGTLVAALLTALMAQASAGASRVWAGLISVILFVALAVWLSRRLTERAAAALTRLRRTEPLMAVAAYASLVAPLIIFGYALIGGLIPLVVAMIVAAAAELVVLLRR
ncbi:tetratricopeptide repeat protein [Actinoplanes sp. NPDC049265]|uniref:tetratricopeptide repeat protein n=1 Tax=Actinoplanes sp. NPDC049265 TaxID=3363902 RepID=UPI003712CC8F